MVLWEETKENPGSWSTFYRQRKSVGTRKLVLNHHN